MLKAYGYLQRASDTSTNTTKRMKIQGPQTGKAIQTQTQTQKELGPKARQNTEAHKDRIVLGSHNTQSSPQSTAAQQRKVDPQANKQSSSNEPCLKTRFRFTLSFFLFLFFS